MSVKTPDLLKGELMTIDISDRPEEFFISKTISGLIPKTISGKYSKRTLSNNLVVIAVDFYKNRPTYTVKDKSGNEHRGIIENYFFKSYESLSDADPREQLNNLLSNLNLELTTDQFNIIKKYFFSDASLEPEASN